MSVNFVWQDTDEEYQVPLSQTTMQAVELAREALHPKPQPGQVIWGLRTPVKKVKEDLYRWANSAWTPPPPTAPTLMERFIEGSYSTAVMLPQEPNKEGSSSESDNISSRKKSGSIQRFTPRSYEPAPAGHQLHVNVVHVDKQITKNQQKKQRHEQKKLGGSHAGMQSVSRSGSSEGAMALLDQPGATEQGPSDRPRSRSKTRRNLSAQSANSDLDMEVDAPLACSKPDDQGRPQPGTSLAQGPLERDDLFSPIAPQGVRTAAREPSLIEHGATARDEKDPSALDVPPTQIAGPPRTARTGARPGACTEAQMSGPSKSKTRQVAPMSMDRTNVECEDDEMVVDSPGPPDEHDSPGTDHALSNVRTRSSAQTTHGTPATKPSTSVRPPHPLRDPSPTKPSSSCVRPEHATPTTTRPTKDPAPTRTAPQGTQCGVAPRALGMRGPRRSSARLHQPFKPPRPSQPATQGAQDGAPRTFAGPTRTQTCIAGVPTTVGGPLHVECVYAAGARGAAVQPRVSSAPAGSVSKPPPSGDAGSRDEHMSDAELAREKAGPRHMSRRSLSPDSSFGQYMSEWDIDDINEMMKIHDRV